MEARPDPAAWHRRTPSPFAEHGPLRRRPLALTAIGLVFLLGISLVAAWNGWLSPLGARLAGGGRVSVLLLGIGGEGEDAVNTDTVMLAVLDGSSRQVQLVSLARDLWVPIPAWPDGHQNAAWQGKLETAYAVGADPKLPGRQAAYTGRLGGGHLAEAVVTRVTGIAPDAFVAVDLVALRDAVDAVGGLDLCLRSPIDDPLYPDGHLGYVRGGVHFHAGCQHLDGIRAVQVARSRQADQASEAGDAARVARQQLVVDALRHRAGSGTALLGLSLALPRLLNHAVSDLAPLDALALRTFVGSVPAAGWRSTSVSAGNLLLPGVCGPRTPDVLCPASPAFDGVRHYVGSLPLPPAVEREQTPIRVMSDFTSEDERTRVDALLRPIGLSMLDPQPEQYVGPSMVYDLSRGHGAATAVWLEKLLGFPAATGGAPPPQLPLDQRRGIVIVLGQDVDGFLYGAPD